jgi:hypothetical protein
VYDDIEAGRARKPESVLVEEVESGSLEASNPSIPDTVVRFCAREVDAPILVPESEVVSGLDLTDWKLEDGGVAVPICKGGGAIMDGDWRTDPGPFVGLEFDIVSFACEILASHPLAKSIDFPLLL